MRFVGSLGEAYDVVAAIPADESGESYLVRDSEGAIATLVILGARLAADDEMRARFIERRAQASRAESEAVLVSKDLGTHEGRPFLVYPFVAGVTLRQLLGALHANGRRFHPEVACALVHHLATSLDEVHDTPDDQGQAMRLAHGAVSADRVLIGFDGRVGLSGFGIARDLSIPPSSGDVRAIDSRRYAAPEVLRGEPEDTRSDVFSLAIVLWESITLRKWQRDAGYVSVSDLVPDAPSALDLAIAQSVSADPSRRPPSLDEFAHLLAMACPLAGRVRLSRVGDLVSTIVTPERARGRMNLPADVAERLDGARREMDPSTIEELTSPLEGAGPCEFGDELGKWARVPGRASVPPPMAAGVSGVTMRPASVRPPVNVRAPVAAAPTAAKVETPSPAVASTSAPPSVEPNTRRASVPPPRASRAPAPPSVVRMSKPLVPSPERPRVAPAPFPAPKISPPSPIAPRVAPLAAPRVASPAAAVAARAPMPAAAMEARVAGAAARAVPTPAPVVHAAPDPVAEPAKADVAADSRLVPRPRATATPAAPKPSAPRPRTLAGTGAPPVVAAPATSEPTPAAAVQPPRLEREVEVASAITARPVERAAAFAGPPSVAQVVESKPASLPPPPPATWSSVPPPAPSAPKVAVALPTPAAFVAVPHASQPPAPSAAPIPTAVASPAVSVPQAPIAAAPVTAAAAERPPGRGMYLAFGAFALATAAAIAMGVLHMQQDANATATPEAVSVRPASPTPATPPPRLVGSAAPAPAPTPRPSGLVMPALSAGAHPEASAPVAEEREDRHHHHHDSSSTRERPRTTTSSHGASITSAASTMAPTTTPAAHAPPQAMTVARTQPDDDDLSFRERRRLRRERRRAD